MINVDSIHFISSTSGTGGHRRCPLVRAFTVAFRERQQASLYDADESRWDGVVGNEDRWVQHGSLAGAMIFASQLRFIVAKRWSTCIAQRACAVAW